MRTASPPAPELLLFGLMREPSLSYFRHGSLFLLNPFFFPCFSFIFLRFFFYSLSFSTGRDSWGENKSWRHERINRPTTRKQQTGHKPPTETNGQMLFKKQKNKETSIKTFRRISFVFLFLANQRTHQLKCRTLLISLFRRSHCVLRSRKKMLKRLPISPHWILINWADTQNGDF